MFNARVNYTVGWGLEILSVSANSYQELVSKLDNFMKWVNADSSRVIEKIIYNYPSGKKFVKTF